MTLRASELLLVCAELDAQIAGMAIRKVVQPDAETVLLGLRGADLLICASARAGRLHLVEERGGTGEAPPSFCMLLRKHLVGARVVAVRAIEGERACELELQSADDAPRLRLFLFGAAAQLQLVARADSGGGGETRVLGAIGPAKQLYAALPPPRALVSPPSRFLPPLSPAIAAAYATVEHDADVDDARRAARQRLEAQHKKLERLAAALTGDLARVDGAEARKKEGDLLLAHLGEIPRGQASVTLPDDFTDGSPLTIALDPARSPRDNAARLYKEHKRLGRARAAIERRLDETRARLATLAAQRASLDAGGPVPLVAPRRTPQKARELRAEPFRRFTSATGAAIWVGRGAARNDELTWKVARGNDLWLHTRDVPGAHVVVPLVGGRDVDAETLVDAATLAAHHSSARDEAQVDVGYALRKHLRKPRGAPPGAVLVSNEKTLRVRMEPARLERLLKRDDDG